MRMRINYMNDYLNDHLVDDVSENNDVTVGNVFHPTRAACVVLT